MKELDQTTTELRNAFETFEKETNELSNKFYYNNPWPTQFTIDLIEEAESHVLELENDLFDKDNTSLISYQLLKLNDLMVFANPTILDSKYIKMMADSYSRLNNKISAFVKNNTK